MSDSTTRPPVCDYEGSSYQHTFWEQGGRAYEDAAEAIALRRLLPPSGQLLLEVGAGAGRNTPRYHGFERVVLLDYSITQLQQARERLGDSSRYVYVAADAYQLPFVDGLFDCATMIRVLHHMADGPGVLAEVRRVLARDATFILEYANKLNLKAILRFLTRRQTWNPFSPEPVEFVELNFNFHPKTTRQWLREAGFKIERQRTVSHFRVGFLKKHVPLRLLAAADGLASLTGDLWQLSPSVFVRNRATGPTVSSPAPGAFFRCPICHHAPLESESKALVCVPGGHRWPVVDGIHVFKNGNPGA